MQEGKGNENRLVAALGYPIWVVAVVVLLTDMKQNRFMRAHAIQALGYAVAWVVIFIAFSILASVPFVGWGLWFLWPALYLGWFIIALFYAYRAYQGQTFSIPVVSQFTARYTGPEG